MSDASLNRRHEDDSLFGEPTAWSDRIAELLVKYTVPGLSIARLSQGEVAWCASAGVREAGKPEPTTADTVFEAASLSKPVLAYAALRLVGEGQLELDSPLEGYLSEPYLEQEPAQAPITARHVLSHTTGLPNWRKKGETLRAQHPPGARFSYSGEGYIYLQKAIAEVCAAPIEEVLSSLVFGPLRMETSTFLWPTAELSNCALPHDERGTPRKKAPWPQANSAAGLHCTAHDYAKLMAAILARPDSPPDQFSSAAISEMLTPQVQVNDQPSWHPDWPSGNCRESTTVGWGLGWGLCTVPGERSFWHWGDNETFQAFAMGWPAVREGVVVLTNSANGQTLIEELLREFVPRTWHELEWLHSLYGR